MTSTLRELRLALVRFPQLRAMAKFFKRVVGEFCTAVFEILRVTFANSNRFGPVRGCYSAYEMLRSGDAPLEGRIAIVDQGAPAIPDPSIILLCRRRQHLEQPWPIFWSHHRRVRLVGASLAHVNERKEVCSEAVYGKSRVRDDPAYNYLSFRRPTKLDGAWTSVISRWVSTDIPQPFAHWLLEALPRLAFLSEFPSETQILIPPQRMRYQVESLEILGLWKRCRPTSERHLLLEDYYFSAPGSMIVCYNPFSVKYLRATFLDCVPKGGATPPPRFFVRRTGTFRNMVNEAQVIEFFREAGWSIVDLAVLSFSEQIQLFSQAEAICGIHGSGFAHVVWCQKGCKVVELFADSYLAGDQEWICQCVKADYHFLIFPSDHRFNALVDTQVVARKLQSLGMM